MFLHKAMRYYRLWIYSANAVILLGAIIFGLSVLYVGSDYRLKLIVSPTSSIKHPPATQLRHRAPIHEQHQQQQASQVDTASSADSPPPATPKSSSSSVASANRTTAASQQQQQHQDGASSGESRFEHPYSWMEQDISVRPTEPNLLLAYMAVAIQAGLLQALGCFGAMRMKERFIQAFWLLILALTLFDIVFFFYWVNRFQVIHEGLQRHLAARLREQYGWRPEVGEAAPPDNGGGRNYSIQSWQHQSSNLVEQSDKKRLDKIFTQILIEFEPPPPHFRLHQEIVDKIQAESQCCGILRPSDYSHSAWHRLQAGHLVRLAQERHLNRSRNTTTSPPSQISSPDYHYEVLNRLVHKLHWVPASCCRRTPLGKASNRIIHKFLDDSQVPRSGNPVPAWAPGSNEQRTGSIETSATAATTFGPPTDTLQDKFMGNPSRRRLLAKQGIYGPHKLPAAATEEKPPQQEERSLKRRWAVESRVDERGQILMRIVREGQEEAEAEVVSGGESKPRLDGAEHWSGTLANLRHLLLRNKSEPSSSENFVWNNSLALSLHQFKLVESYLRRRSRRHLRPLRPLDSEEVGGAKELGVEERLEGELVASIRSELTCFPTDFADSNAIYTEGCQPHIRAWLEASGHLLFVSGFCILTVLKLCSLLLLRLEIREMIHKIRVLNGMATEYNGLADLEAYLPRPSLCLPTTQPTPELPASPIPPSVPAAAAASPTYCPPMSPSALNQQQQHQHLPQVSASPSPTRRLGGSFSEAVVAAASKQLATAAASQQKSLQQQHHHHPTLSANRANSMKAVIGTSGMLAPSNAALTCARSTSAHLHHLSALANPAKTTGGYLNAQSSLSAADHLFASGMIPLSRRHTAVSVCPAAAAAVAAAAAHHLMSRRGTCYTNPAFPLAGVGGGGCGAGGLGAASNQLSHHRHSTHTVPQLGEAGGGGSQKQVAIASTSSPPQPSEHGGPSAEAGSGQQQATPRLGELPKPSSSSSSSGAGADQRQLLSLLYPFKRQSSGGAQPACHFSPDTAGPQQQESRRSIH